MNVLASRSSTFDRRSLFTCQQLRLIFSQHVAVNFTTNSGINYLHVM